MTDLEALALENRYQVQGIDSKANGLKDIIDGERRGILVCGRMGMTGLTLSQARTMARELPGILDSFFSGGRHG